MTQLSHKTFVILRAVWSFKKTSNENKFSVALKKKKMGGKKGEGMIKNESPNDEAILTRRKIVKGLGKYIFRLSFI